MMKTRTAISYHAPALFDRAEEAAKQGQGVACAILAAAAIEALTHDLTECYKFAIDLKASPNSQKPSIFNIPGTTKLIVSNYPYCNDIEELIYKKLESLEKAKKSIQLKYDSISEIIVGQPYDKGTKTYQEFDILINIRNGIVHSKGERLTQNVSQSTLGPIKGYPKFIQTLQQRKIITFPEILTNNSSWLQLIENKVFSEWCISITKEFYLNVVSLLPDTKLSNSFKHEVRL